ncbi:MAG TPA: 7TM-DISM domain-containing protein [Oligoflexus sp.]|uniref:7TM-DISM domain-containing protein n=1 Tax=Oligoflexus sp. TaxID=1971216 RepID=UPI002D7EF921|nr:7TM-DISM domain-containing protein [Oligoflexus sp.]HET9238553.1 7TM-DISM domain-containing protein [Oligoflexus sp.]
MLKLLIILLLGLLVFDRRAEGDILRLPGVMPGISLGTHIETLEDRTGSLLLDDVRAPDAGFVPSHQQHPNFGFTRSAYWARFQVENPGTKPMPAYFEYGYANTDKVAFYFPDEQGQYQKKEAGDRVSYATRDIAYRLPVFVTEVPPGVHTYYVRVQTEGVNQIPLHVWSPTEFDSKRASEAAFLGVIYGFFVVMLFYNAFLGIVFRSLSYLFYICFILCSIANHFGYQGLYLVFFPAESAHWLANEGFIMATGALVFFACTFSLMFLNMNRVAPLVKWALLIEAGLGLLVFPIAPFSYNIAVKIATVNAFLASGVVLTASVIACVKRYRPAYFFTLAWFLTIVGNLANPLALAGIIPISLFTNWSHFIGIAVEVVLISIALGDKMRLAQERSEQKVRQMNEKLEEIVDEKTRDIKSILSNIKLGIFAIVPEKFAIHRDFSMHLREIFKSRKIEESNALDLLLEGSAVSGDQRHQIKAALEASFGEDEMVFEMNEGALPKEIQYRSLDSTQRILEIDWNPMLSKARKVERILVTCKDVTDLRLIKLAAENQQKELEYIGELINVNQEMFSKFATAARRFLSENAGLLQNNDVIRPDILKMLFINMHTIKGAARSLGFRELTNTVHMAEEALSEIQKGSRIADKAALLAELAQVETSLGTYEWINNKKLNRTLHTPDTIELRVEDLEREIMFIEDIERLKDLDSVTRSLSQMKQRLVPYVFRNAQQVLTEICESVPKLAKDLGKECPELRIEAKDIFLTHACTEMLRHIFVHILRNALDHGIESAAERTLSGKNERGVIDISMVPDSAGWLTLTIRDDGRGLALQLIKQIAVIKGFLPQHSPVQPEDVAQFIFESGFSTSAGVSDISGRGIGMEAVRRLLHQHGSRIRLVLNCEGDDEKSFVPFSFHISLPPDMFRRMGPLKSLALVV